MFIYYFLYCLRTRTGRHASVTCTAHFRFTSYAVTTAALSAGDYSTLGILRRFAFWVRSILFRKMSLRMLSKVLRCLASRLYWACCQPIYFWDVPRSRLSRLMILYRYYFAERFFGLRWYICFSPQNALRLLSPRHHRSTPMSPPDRGLVRLHLSQHKSRTEAGHAATPNIEMIVYFTELYISLKRCASHISPWEFHYAMPTI